MNFVPRSSRNFSSRKRAVSLVAAVLIVGAIAASIITVSGRAAGLGFRWPVSFSKIFASRTATPVTTAPAGVTYFSQGSLDPTLLASWNTLPAGGGATPPNFTSGDIFEIQNGHNMTTGAAWSISGSGSQLRIAAGGTLTSDNAVTLASATAFQIAATGTYVHNNNSAYGSTIFQGTELFDAASTVILQNSNGTGPSGVTFGNLTVNLTAGPNVQCSGNLTSIAGDFTFLSTGGLNFTLSGATSYTLTIGGKLDIQNGNLVLSNGNAAGSTFVVNINEDYTQSGGSLNSTNNLSAAKIVFTGGPSSATFAKTAGTLTGSNINWQVASGKTLQIDNSFSLSPVRTFTVDSGGVLALNSGYLNSGTTTINGELGVLDGANFLGSNFVYGAGASLAYTGTSARSSSNNEFPSSSGPTNLTINNAGGITLHAARTIGGTLTLTNGKLTTTSSNLLTVSNTATNAVSAGSTTTYVSGPLARTLPASLASGSIYVFPIGKLGFNPFELVNPTTNAGGTITVTAEEFDANSNGIAGSGLSALNSDRYWDASITNSANFINTTVRLTDSSVTAANAIGKATSAGGTYDSIGGTVSNPTITSDAFTTFSSFVIGTAATGNTISGTLSAGLDSDGQTITLLKNGASATSVTTNGSGDYSFTGVTYSSGDVLTVFVDDDNTTNVRGATVTRGNTGDITGLNIDQNVLILRHEDGGPITNANLATGSNGDAELSAIYTTLTGTLTVPAGKELRIFSGKTFAPGGNVNAGGNWTNNGTFTAGANSVTFNGTASQTIGGNSATTFATLNISGTTVSLSGASFAPTPTTVTTALNITSGVFNQGPSASDDFNLATNAVSVSSGATWRNLGKGDVTLSGNVSNSGTINLDSNGTGCGADDILIRSSDGVTPTPRTWGGTGTFLLIDVDVKDQKTAAPLPPLVILVRSGANSGGNTGFVFDASCPAGTYTWIGGTLLTPTDWTVGTNWSPTRTPAVGDELIFDGGVTSGPTVTNVPSETISKLTLQNGVFPVTLSSTLASTLTVTSALAIPASTRLILSGSSPIQISLDGSATATIGGQLAFTGAAHRLLGNSTNAITFSGVGSRFTADTGAAGNPFGNAVINDDTVRFQDGSEATFNAGGDPFGGDTRHVTSFTSGSTATFNIASALSCSGSVAVDTVRSYGSLVLDGSQTYTCSNANALTVLKNFTLKDGSSLTLSGSSGGNLSLFGNFTDENTGGTASFSANGRTVLFQGGVLTGGSTQTVTKSAGATLAFGDVVVNKADVGGSVKLGSALIINGALQFSGNASAVDVIEFNSQALTLNGTFSDTSGSGANGFKGDSGATLNIGGTGALATLNFVSGSQLLSSLTVNRTSSGSVTFGTDFTVSGATALTNGVVDMGSQTLSLDTAPTRTNGYVSGYLRRNFTCPAGPGCLVTFDVGTPLGGYSPVTESLTVGSAGGYSQRLKAVHGKHSSISGTNALSRYWTVDDISGPSTPIANVTFHYPFTDVVGSEANYKFFKHNGSSFTQLEPDAMGVNSPEDHFATKNGVTSFSDWTLAEPASVFGVIGFSGAPYATLEGNGTDETDITVTVTRTGGSSGAVSVDYAVTDGTANSADYEVIEVDGVASNAATGTLTWADGNSTAKLLKIRVHGDDTYEANETVDLTLSNPQGGATITGTNPTTLTINNDDPQSTTTSITNTTELAISTTEGNSFKVAWSVDPEDTGTPTGTVTVTVDGGAGCSAPVADGECFVHNPTPGTKSLVASYSGDSNFLPSTSGSESHTVIPAVCANAPTGMVGWWPGDGNPNDIQGPTFENAALFGGATFDAGKVDQAFKFDGVDDYAAQTLPANVQSPTITVDAWVNLNTLAGDNIYGHTIVAAEPGGTNTTGRGVILAVSTSGVPRFTKGSGSSYQSVSAGTTVLSPGVWYHLAGTYDGATMKVYVNGVEEGSLADAAGIAWTDFGGQYPNPAQLYFGAFKDSVGGAPTVPQHGFLNGRIDEIEIFNSALDGTAVAAIYNASFAGKCRTCTPAPENMVSWWSGENNANDIYGVNNGTLQNGATFATGKVGQAFSFNGAPGGQDRVHVPFNASLNATGSQLTLDGWIKPAAITNSLYFGRSAPSDHNYLIFFNGTSIAIVLQAGGVQTEYVTGYVPAVNAWTHLALVYDGAAMKLYANGLEVFSGAKTGTVDSSSLPFFIGNSQGNLGASFDGLIDEVEVIDRALTQPQIAAIANSQNAGKCHTSTFQFDSSTYSANEGDGTKSITITRTGTHDTVATVNYSATGGTATGGTGCAPGEDYDTAFVPTSLTFNPGEISKSFNVPICNDTPPTFEGDETVDLTISGVTGDGASVGSPNLTTLTINDDADKPTFAIDDVEHNEGNTGTTSYTFTVTKTGTTTQSSSVKIDTQDGTATVADGDYTANTDTLTFAAADTQKQFTVLVNGDNKYEITEAFTVKLSAPTGATISDDEGTGTITNDDAPPVFSIDSVTQNEGDAGATNYVFTVTRTGATALPSSVQFDTDDGTATVADNDYADNSGTLTFAATDPSTQTITVVVNGDNKYENTEAFTVKLTNASGATISPTNGTGTGTITNDDSKPTILINDPSQAEGTGGSTSDQVFTVTLSNPTYETVTVDYLTANGVTNPASGGLSCGGTVDYETKSGIVTFVEDDVSETITIKVCHDNTYELNETFVVDLTSPVNASPTGNDAQGVGTITNDDPEPVISIDDVTLPEGNEPDTTGFQFTVTLTNPSYETITVDYATADDTAVAPADYVAVSATTLTFDPGETSKTFIVTVNGDSLYELSEQFFVNLSNVTGTASVVSGANGQGVGTVTTDDPLPAFSINDRNNFEGTVPSPTPTPPPVTPITTTQTFTVTKDPTRPTAITSKVNFATANGTTNGATGGDGTPGNSCGDPGIDYISQSGTLTFPASGTGSSTQSITVVICKDSDFEPDETFTVDLSAPVDAVITDNQGVGTIKNDDVPTGGYVVNTTDDTNDGNCDAAHCSLREAIIAANGGSIAVAINFAIPDDDALNLSGSRHYYYANDNTLGTLGAVTQTTADEATIATLSDPDWPHSWWSISLSSPLPDIGTTHQVFVEGYTQPGAVDNSATNGSTNAILRIEVDGQLAGANVTGLILNSGSTVRGLVINRFQRDSSAGTPLGFGIQLKGSSDNVAGCFIGTDVSGTLDLGNGGSGISLESGGGHTVGGTTASTSTPEVTNLISGNDGDGIAVSSVSNMIQGNLIGTKSGGSNPLGNSGSGISFSGAGFNTVGIDANEDTNSGEGNTIAHNTGDGVVVLTGTGNSIRGNSIFSNGTTLNDLGIDLSPNGVAVNDDKDPDSGANNLQNYPIITSALVTGSTRTITGTLNSTADQTFTLDFYESPALSCSASENGEGTTYLGSTSVTTDATTGDVSFTFHPTSLTIGKVLTATATSEVGANTSEFSACAPIQNGSPGAGEIKFTDATYTVGENGVNAAITVKREGGTNGSVSATLNTSNGTATAGSDYTAVSQVVTFNEGDAANKTVNVPISEDLIFEGNETVELTLGDTAINLTGGPRNVGPDQAAVLTITDNDAAPVFSINDVTQAEGNTGTTAFTFTVTKTGATVFSSSVNYATANGTATAGSDYTAIAATTLTFLPGDTSKQFTVQVSGENVFEANETFVVNLSNPTNSTIGDNQGIGTINNDDAQPTISIGDKSQSEGNSGSANFDFAVTLSNPSSEAITVFYSTADGTALQPGDYTSKANQPLTFLPGVTSATASVSVNGDNVFEVNETFFVNLSNVSPTATIADGQGLGTITNDETQPTISITDVSLNEGNAGPTTFTFTVTLSGASSQEVTVNYATANGTASAPSDYTAVPSTLLTFAALETSKTINVTVTGDTALEGNETFSVNLTAPANATIADSVGLGTILNDDTPVLQFAQSTYTVSEETGFVEISVTRTGDLAQAVAVEYASSDLTPTPEAIERRDYTTAVGTLRFAAGEATQKFTVLVGVDSYTENPEHFQITLSNASGGAVLGVPATATVQIDNSAGPAPNAYDNARNFVRRHYHDFLNREPDEGGLNFWTEQITACGSDAACIARKRVDVSASFFQSIEFQETGYLVERLYKTAYGDGSGASTCCVAGTPSHSIPVPIVKLREFLADTQQIGKGVVVGAPGWPEALDNNKNAFIAEFVQRSRFTTDFPASMAGPEFVDKLNANAGSVLSAPERAAQIAVLGGTPADPAKRAQVVRAVAEDADLRAAEFNRAFVLMQYLGYLRRNPNDPQDTDHTGYDFWLTKLNQFNGNFFDAQMVFAFIDSIEYKARYIPQ